MVDEVIALIEKDKRIHYKGRANNIGVWSSREGRDPSLGFEFSKKIGGTRGKSFGDVNILLLEESIYGLWMKVEFYLPSYCEWYNMFEGYLEQPSDYTYIMRLLGV